MQLTLSLWFGLVVGELKPWPLCRVESKWETTRGKLSWVQLYSTRGGFLRISPGLRESRGEQSTQLGLFFGKTSLPVKVLSS